MAGRTMEQRIREMLRGCMHYAIPACKEISEDGTPCYLYDVVNRETKRTYRVDLRERTCTCEGFQFGGICKHIRGLRPLLWQTALVLEHAERYENESEWDFSRRLAYSQGASWTRIHQINRDKAGFILDNDHLLGLHGIEGIGESIAWFERGDFYSLYRMAVPQEDGNYHIRPDQLNPKKSVVVNPCWQVVFVGDGVQCEKYIARMQWLSEVCLSCGQESVDCNCL